MLVKNNIKFPEIYTCESLHQYKEEDIYFNLLCYNYDNLILELPFYGIAHRIREGSTNQQQKQLKQPPKGHYLADLYADIMSRDIQNLKLLDYLSQKAKEFNISLK